MHVTFSLDRLLPSLIAGGLQIRDPKVRKLADQIVESPVREIRAMELLLGDIRRDGRRVGGVLPAVPAVVTPEIESKAR